MVHRSCSRSSQTMVFLGAVEGGAPLFVSGLFTKNQTTTKASRIIDTNNVSRSFVDWAVEGALLGSSSRHHRFARGGHRRTLGLRVRRRVCPPPWARPDQHGQVPHKRDPHHRGRTTPAQVPNARWHGGHRIRRRSPAGSGATDLSSLRDAFPLSICVVQKRGSCAPHICMAYVRRAPVSRGC